MYSIRIATVEELPMLAPLERAAAELFRRSPYPHLADGPLAVDSLQPDDCVWVAVDGRTIAGFAIARKTHSAMHIQEIDVHPLHARRGLGRQLIEHIADWARDLGLETLTLTTFDDVPWNGPYYTRIGFHTVAAQSMTAELHAILKAEDAAGIPMAHRICMQMLLLGSR